MYKAAVIGCGRIGFEFDFDAKRDFIASHVGAYVNSKMIELSAVCDKDSKKVKRCADSAQVPAYLDAEDMLVAEEPHIVSICTPPDSHLELVRLAVKHGVKGIFCEKPISESVRDAREMITLCKKNEVILQIGFQRRFCRAHYGIKRQIDDGLLGEPLNATGIYTSGILNSGSHMLDLLLLYFNTPKMLRGYSSKKLSHKPGDANYDVFLRYRDDFVCSLHACDSNDYQMFELDMLFTKGRIRIVECGLSMELYAIADSERYSTYKEPRLYNIIQTDLSKDFMVRAVNHLANCVATGHESISNGISALKGLKLVKWIVYSAEHNREVVL